MSRSVRPPPKADRPTAPLSVYDGRLCVGEIEDRGRGRVTAYALDEGRRIKIGIFETRGDAMRAISGGRQ